MLVINVDLSIINELRKMKGLTSEQLAEKSGVPIGTLNKIIRGKTKNPKLETLKALAKVLECHLDDFDPYHHNQSLNDCINDLQVDERDLITAYRCLPINDKRKVQDYLKAIRS